jgi:hypothetical protein
LEGRGTAGFAMVTGAVFPDVGALLSCGRIDNKDEGCVGSPVLPVVEEVEGAGEVVIG